MPSNEEEPDAKRARTEPFRWRKKEAQDRRAGLTREEAEQRDAARRAEAQREIERLSARRAQREDARRAREEEKAQRVREAEAASMAEWVAKEDEFMLEQSKARAIIRVRDRRAHPIDWLIVHALWMSTDLNDENDVDVTLDMRMKEPTELIRSLLPSELHDLRADVRTLARLDSNHAQYWKDVLVLCEDLLYMRKNADGSSVSTSILADVDAMLADKSADDLLALQTSIQAKMRSGEPLDVEYWETMLSRIVVWHSVAKLRETHVHVTQRRVTKFRQQQEREAERQKTELAEQVGPASDMMLPDKWDSSMEVDGRRASDLSPDERQLPTYTLQSYRAMLREARRNILAEPLPPRIDVPWVLSGADTAEDLVRREAARAMGVDEEAFNDDVGLTQQAFHWESKYRPRKPRYFNRVHTGYEWNRYNQTHYDANNPPPKIVQGYKFHIFYPDLIDPFKAPTYRVLPDPEGPGDTVLLRFSAGPPYEDIAFRIIQREWDYSFKRGFRSSFDRGILQLHCTFLATYNTQSTLSGSSTGSS